MPANCRVPVAVHVVLLLAATPGATVTSSFIAGSVNTNPVVIRRLLLALREAGLVTAAKGATGGFALARPPEQITVRDIYRAVEPSDPLPMPDVAGNPRCPVGAHVQAVLQSIFTGAQSALETHLGRTTLATLLAEINERATRSA